MKNKLVLAAGLAAAAFASAPSANAAVIFSDNFNAGVAGPNWAGDGVFRSIPQPGNVHGLPSVDLVGPGYFPGLDYLGTNSIDLDGSTGIGNNPAGELLSVMSLTTGNYTVSFVLAGNLRHRVPETTVVSIGSQSFSIIPPNTQPYTPYTLNFTGVSGQLSFLDKGPSNQQGNLLDNVVVSSAVPEASTWLMMVAGFAGLGFAGYRARKGNRIAQFS